MELQCHLLDGFRPALKNGDGVPSKEGLWAVQGGHCPPEKSGVEEQH